jgi:hypothetical protein
MKTEIEYPIVVTFSYMKFRLFRVICTRVVFVPRFHNEQEIIQTLEQKYKYKKIRIEGIMRT